MEYIIDVSIELRYKITAESKEDAISQAEDMNMPEHYIIDSFEIVNLKGEN